MPYSAPPVCREAQHQSPRAYRIYPATYIPRVSQKTITVCIRAEPLISVRFYIYADGARQNFVYACILCAFSFCDHIMLNSVP